MAHPRITLAECFGLSPLPRRLREALLTFRGDAQTPPSRFDTSSLRILQPALSLPLWLGHRARDRRAPIYNLFSHVRPSPREGWSVRVTTARDFRGLQATYDSHNGTDFAVPPGTTVVAAAPGRVLRVSSEFDRGGLKVFIDHGRGLFTSSNHLARALVTVGDRVSRGQPVALSGMSGIDGFLMFPWSTPHVHFNVWLGGEYVDPFARVGEVSLWRSGNDPVPHDGAPDDASEPTDWDEDGLALALESCTHEGARRDISSGRDLAERGMNAHFQRSYYPTRFRAWPALHRHGADRLPLLDLPFSREDYVGVSWPSEARSRVRGG